MSRKLPLVLLLSLLLIACKNEPKETEKPLTFTLSETVKKSGEGCHTNEFNCTVISLEVPIAEGPQEVAEKINHQLQQHVFSLVSWEEISKAANYEEFAKEFIAKQQEVEASFHSGIPWRTIVIGSIQKQTPNLVSIGIDSEVFTGGAHGYSSLGFLNFNPKSGKQYQKSELLTPEFTDYAEASFRKQNNIPEADSINSTGFWFENDAFHLPNYIGFTKDKLILIYNAYEIASYADGEFRLEYPLKEIQEYLKIKVEPQK